MTLASPILSLLGRQRLQPLPRAHTEMSGRSFVQEIRGLLRKRGFMVEMEKEPNKKALYVQFNSCHRHRHARNARGHGQLAPNNYRAGWGGTETHFSICAQAKVNFFWASCPATCIVSLLRSGLHSTDRPTDRPPGRAARKHAFMHIYGSFGGNPSRAPGATFRSATHIQNCYLPTLLLTAYTRTGSSSNNKRTVSASFLWRGRRRTGNGSLCLRHRTMHLCHVRGSQGA